MEKRKGAGAPPKYDDDFEFCGTPLDAQLGCEIDNDPLVTGLKGKVNTIMPRSGFDVFSLSDESGNFADQSYSSRRFEDTTAIRSGGETDTQHNGEPLDEFENNTNIASQQESVNIAPLQEAVETYPAAGVLPLRLNDLKPITAPELVNHQETTPSQKVWQAVRGLASREKIKISYAGSETMYRSRNGDAFYLDDRQGANLHWQYGVAQIYDGPLPVPAVEMGPLPDAAFEYPQRDAAQRYEQAGIRLNERAEHWKYEHPDKILAQGKFVIISPADAEGWPETLTLADGRLVYDYATVRDRIDPDEQRRIDYVELPVPPPPAVIQIAPLPEAYFEAQADKLDPTKWNISKPEWFLGKILGDQMRVMLFGTTGRGKTTFALGMALHVASGKDFMHWKVPSARRVLYIDGEMSDAYFDLRMREGLQAAGIDTVPRNLRVLARSQREIPDLDTEEGQEFLRQFIKRYGPFDLIVFDNMKCLIGRPLNTEDAWLAIKPFVLDLTKDRIGQLWVTHGSNKDHSNEKDKQFFGSDTPSWQMDTVAKLGTLTGKTEIFGYGLSFDIKARWRDQAPDDFKTVDITLDTKTGGGWKSGIEKSADQSQKDNAGTIEEILRMADITSLPGWTRRKLAIQMTTDEGERAEKETQLKNMQRSLDRYGHLVHHDPSLGWRWYLAA